MIELYKAYTQQIYDELNVEYKQKEAQIRTKLQMYINEIFKSIYDGGLSLTIDEHYNISVYVTDFDGGVETSTAQSISDYFEESDYEEPLPWPQELVQPEPFEDVAASMSRSALLDTLNSLTPRESDVIRLRTGFDNGQPLTLEEVGAIYGVTRERIRQIEAKALRKLRHSSRAKKLKDFW